MGGSGIPLNCYIPRWVEVGEGGGLPKVKSDEKVQKCQNRIQKYPSDTNGPFNMVSFFILCRCTAPDRTKLKY